MEKVKLIYHFAESLMGLDPLLLVVVWVIVSLIAFATKLRSRAQTKDGRHFALAILCFIVSTAVVFLVEPSGTAGNVIAEKVLKLAGLSSITYQLFKPLTRGMVRFIINRFERATGVDVDEDETK